MDEDTLEVVVVGDHQRLQITNAGTFLLLVRDLSPGKDIAPGSVTEWMAKLKEYAMTTYKSRISMIFGADGTLGDYPVYALPDEPGNDATVYERDIWKLDRTEYGENLTKLEEDKLNLYGAALGQMSKSSRPERRRCRPASKPRTNLSRENCFKQFSQLT